MKTVAGLLSIFISLNAVAKKPNLANLCQRHHQILTQGIHEKMSIEDLMAVAAQSDLVFIGESHMEGDRRNVYRSLVRFIKQRDLRFNCLFLEQDKSYYERPFAACNEDSSVLNSSLFWSEDQNACQNASSSWRPASNEAYALSMKVFAVDAASECERIHRKDRESWNCRDVVMARNIQQLFDSGQCDKAISINGASHVIPVRFDSYEVLGRKTFYSKDRSPKRTFKVNFMYSDIDYFFKSDLRWRWVDMPSTTADSEKIASLKPLCSEEPPVLEEDFGFLHRSLGTIGSPYIWFDGKPLGNMLEFDASVVIGR